MARTVLPMVCVCKDEGKAVAKELNDWAETLIGDHEEIGLVSALVMELNWEHEAWVTQMAADMWFGVEVTLYPTDEKIYITCDRVEDGLIAILRHLVERKDK